MKSDTTVRLTDPAAGGTNAETLGTILIALRHWTLILVYVYTAVGFREGIQRDARSRRTGAREKRKIEPRRAISPGLIS
ncbi:MAG: hypothetical protein M3Z28_04585 [Candidatus Dormibacteraeota bacterium]|nr:hypothetical protein [Candidatus Dormibacteraeota bacterium]